MSEPASSALAAAASAPRWRHSLLFTLVLAAAASALVVTALLFFAIDYFVSQQFEALRAERLTHASEQVRATVGRELAALDNLAELLSKDVELNNASYYHLYLDGEIEHPRAALLHLATAARLDAARLWDVQGHLVAATPSPGPMTPPALEDESAAGLVLVAGEPWLAATRPLTRAGNTLAVLWIGRPLAGVLAAAFPPGGEVTVRLGGATAPGAGVSLRLDSRENTPVMLDIDVDDQVGRALAEVKRLLAALLPLSAALFILASGVVLHRQLAPLRTLTAAVAAVGRGEFGQRIESRGKDEIAQLVHAFNAMTEDLARLRELERQAGQQERLSAIGRMAARIAHDLNNPLAVIRGVAELARKEASARGDARLAEDNALILHHIERCQRTVEQLLAYGRPIRLACEPLDLNHLVGEVAGRWRAQHAHARLECVPAAAPLPVRADPYQFERVLDNLLINAREAAPDGRIEVRLSSAGGMAVLRVIDTGPGFSAAARAHLFEPFQTTKRGGSGLGLASCRAIVDAHGGRIEVADAGHGEVVVYLPLDRS